MLVGICMENWGYQVITFISGRNGTAAPMAIMYNIWGILWALYWGWGLALQIRIGKHVGAGNIAGAKRVVRISLMIVVTLVTAVACLTYILRRTLPTIFSDDANVVADAAAAMPILAIDYFFGCLGLCACNLLEGMSRNTAMAIVTSIGTWCVTVPLSAYFALWCPWFQGSSEMRLKGLWCGSAVGECVKCAILWFIVLRTNWKTVVEERARARQTRRRKELKMLLQRALRLAARAREFDFSSCSTRFPFSNHMNAWNGVLNIIIL